MKAFNGLKSPCVYNPVCIVHSCANGDEACPSKFIFCPRHVTFMGSSVKLPNMISVASLLFLFLKVDIFSAVIFRAGGVSKVPL